MDLRRRKTERAIREAFMELRAAKPLERITVRELCERAEVGKATFYLHYHDIYDLSGRLQRAVIDDILSNMGDPGLILHDSAEFTRLFARALLERRAVTSVLFSGSQQGVLPQAIEEGVRKHLFGLLPEASHNVRLNVFLTYQIQGCYYAYSMHAAGSWDQEVFDAMLEANTLLMADWLQA